MYYVCKNKQTMEKNEPVLLKLFSFYIYKSILSLGHIDINIFVLSSPIIAFIINTVE